VYYTSSPSATVADASGNPLVQLSPPVDTDLYPADDLNGAVQQAWTVPSDGTVTVIPQLTVASGASGTVTFTVKKQGALVHKEQVTISGGSYSDPSFSLPVSAGDQLYFDYSVADPSLASQISGESVQVAYDGQDPVTVLSALHHATAPAVMSEAYRGWSYVAYNGDGARATQPVDESVLTASLTTSSTYDPTTAKAYPMYPAPADGQWTGPNSSVYVRAGSISSSRLGAPSLTVTSAADFAGASAPATVSDSQQTAVGGGVSLLSGSADSGSTSSDVDYLDMNGSGYPAVVSDGHIQYPDQTGALEPSSVSVPGLGTARSSKATSANVGVGGTAATFKANSQGVVDNPGSPPDGNSTGSQNVSLGLSGSLGSGTSTPQNDLIDMNGDGLPDIVTRGGGQLMVSLNLGYSFAPAEPWGTGQLGDGASENGTIGATLGFNDGIYGYAGGISLSKDKSETGEQLISMTGGVLPDRVINTPSGLEVAFNTGTGFAAPVPFPGAPAGACADSTSTGIAGIDWSTTRLCNGTTSQGAGLYFTVGIGPLCFVGCYVILNPGADTSQSMSREEGALRDVTGSGAPDYVSSSSDGSLTVSVNNIGRTNILKSVSRPLGATITIDYQRAGGTYQLPQQRWVMSHVTVDSGVAGEATQETSYTYSGGVYDRLERTFYGFGTVTGNELDTTKGDAVYRTTVQEYDTSSYYTHGLLLDTRVYDGSGHLYTEIQQAYDTRDVLTGADPADVTSTTATIFPMLVRTDKKYYEGGTTAQKSTYTTQQYDPYGDVIQQYDAGDPGTADDVTTTTSYVSCPGTYVAAFPVSVVQEDANGNVLAHREETVDCATGNVTEVREYLADGTSADTDSTYLPDGMLASVTAPPNQAGQRYKVSYTYDGTTGIYVTSTTDSFGLTSTATQDLRFGTPLTVTDENGSTTSYTYDEFGRTTSVTGPFQQGTGIATITFEYHPDAAVPWAITHNADVYNGPGASIDTVTFADGLDRVIQTKKSATVYTGAGSAPQNVMQVSGHVTFDPFGRTIATYYPVTEPLGTPGVYNTTVNPVAPTTTTYDVLDRAVKVTEPNGVTTSTIYGFGPDRSGATQFTTTVTDANGHVTVTYHNVRNLLAGQEEFHNGTPIWTSYTYDPLDQQASVTDDQGKVTTTSYDLLGRATDVDNPNSGDTQTVYDLVGDKVAEITPNLRAKGEQVSYGYDYNRMVSVTYPDNPGDDVTYTYGAPGAAGNGAGRVIQTTDASGTTHDSYDALGNITYQARTINTTMGMTQPTYITQYTYDTFGRVQSMIYPDGEVLTYHYDSGGLVDKVTGTKGPNSYTYGSSLQYDKFGAKVYIDYGNGVTSNYSYDPLTRRLAAEESAPSRGSDFQDISYTYDNMGDITALANNVAISPNGGFGGPTSQQFSYDDLDRLTSASGTYDFAPKKSNDYTLSMTYNSVSDILEKNQADWVIQPSGKGMVQPITYDSTYSYNGSQENAPTQVGDTSYTYDANGNETGTAANSSGQKMTLTWNDANQLTSLSNNGMETSYVYDASGDRVMKRGAQGETAYVNQYFTIRNGEIGTKQIIVGDTLVAEQMVDHDDTVYEADQYFFQGDQIGSANYVTDASGNVFEHTEYLPTGEVRVQDATDTNNIPFGFAGAETDPESGFSYLGARYYNPVTGIFISPDPALPANLQAVNTDSVPDTFAPSFLNAYNYCDDQPLNRTDPTGMASQPMEVREPLFNGDLYRIARAIGLNIQFPDPEDFIDQVGLRFQATTTRQLGLQENTDFFSFDRAYATYGQHAFVVPDVVGPETRTIFDFTFGVTETLVFPNSGFLEMKTGSGTLTLSSFKFQIKGLLQVAAQSAASEDVGYGHLVPSVTFVAPFGTKIGDDIIAYATDHDVALFRIFPYYVKGTNQIGLYPAIPLNRQAEVMMTTRLYQPGELGTEPGDF
jgi:RHS repeat-associated protein